MCVQSSPEPELLARESTLAAEGAERAEDAKLALESDGPSWTCRAAIQLVDDTVSVHDIRHQARTQQLPHVSHAGPGRPRRRPAGALLPEWEGREMYSRQPFGQQRIENKCVELGGGPTLVPTMLKRERGKAGTCCASAILYLAGDQLSGGSTAGANLRVLANPSQLNVGHAVPLEIPY